MTSLLLALLLNATGESLDSETMSLATKVCKDKGGPQYVWFNSANNVWWVKCHSHKKLIPLLVKV